MSEMTHETKINIVLDELDPTESYSAYQVHVVLNRVLKANGVDGVRPQMMYNYARNGMIVKGEKIFGETLRKFTSQEVAEFVVRYVTKKDLVVKFNIPVNPDQLELDLENVDES